MSNSGKLYIVSTPIGNLKDMTYRAIETLKDVDLIAAEDTRHTKELLNHFDIDTKLTSYHEHNKYDKAKEIIEEIKNGINVAIVTDAGTPIISDPGSVLVKVAIEENIEVTAVPGACAAINAIVLSGLDAKEFTFVGFLSDDNKERKSKLTRLKDEIRTMIFYISPHGFKDDIKDLIDTFGEDRNASVSREMTKKFEETKRGTLKELKDYFESSEIRGEFVLVLEGRDRDNIEDETKEKWLEISIEDHMKYYLDEGKTEKEAMKLVAKDRHIDSREVYKVIKIDNR